MADKILTTNLAKAKVEVQKQLARAAVRALGWHVSDRETLDGLEQLIKNFEEQLRLAKTEISKAKAMEKDLAPDAP